MPYPIAAYLRRVEEMRAHVERLGLAEIEDALANRLALVSAVLSLLRPELPRARHAAFTREVAWYQAWAGFDERELVKDGDSSGLDWLLATTAVDDPADVLGRAAAGEARIFCTAHVGSYRLLNAVLAGLGAPFALVVDARTVREQGGQFMRSFEEIAASRGLPMRQALLDAEAPSVGVQVLRLLRRGVSVVFYIDGNTGTGGMARRDDSMTRVRLFGRALWVRRGVAYLAHAAGVPLVPVFNERTAADARRLTVHRSLTPAADEDRERFAARATQEVYDLLAGYLTRVPSQWEGWLYLHRFLDTAELRPAAAPDVAPPCLGDDDVLSVDGDRFALLRTRAERLLLDRATLTARPLSASARRLLDLAAEPVRVGAAAIDPGARDLAARLVAGGVLRARQVAVTVALAALLAGVTL